MSIPHRLQNFPLLHRVLKRQFLSPFRHLHVIDHRHSNYYLTFHRAHRPTTTGPLLLALVSEIPDYRNKGVRILEYQLTVRQLK